MYNSRKIIKDLYSIYGWNTASGCPESFCQKRLRHKRKLGRTRQYLVFEWEKSVLLSVHSGTENSVKHEMVRSQFLAKSTPLQSEGACFLPEINTKFTFGILKLITIRTHIYSERVYVLCIVLYCSDN